MYRHILLEQHTRFFRVVKGTEFVFKDDNTHSHHSNIVNECHQWYDITRIERPACDEAFLG